jgi:Transcription initiation factor TFIIIB, Brf1 subunit/Transcription initiation factor TFIIB
MKNDLCDKCNVRLIRTKENNLVCPNCGLVYSSEILMTTENGESLEKIFPTLPLGSKITRSSSGLFLDVLNKPLVPKEQVKFNMLKRIDDKMKIYEASSILNSRLLNTLNKISSELNLSKKHIADTAILFSKAIKTLKNFNNLKFTYTTIFAACLFLILRFEATNKVVNLTEITKMFEKYGHRVSKSKIGWCAFLINKNVLNNFIGFEKLIKLYIERYTTLLANSEITSNKLKMRKIESNSVFFISLVKKEALNLLNRINTQEIQGRNPYIIAAALIYLANKKVSKEMKVRPPLSLQDIANVCNLKRFSIRDNAIYLYEKLKNAI